MLQVTHWMDKDKVSKLLPDAAFLLPNKMGGYLAFGTKPSSKDYGFFFNDNFIMYKAIENINIDGKITKITNQFSSVIRERDNKCTEEFIFPYNHNSFIYNLKKYNGNLILDLDCRIFNDNNESERFYNLQLNKNQVLISYKKQGDYSIYVVLTGNKIKAEKIKEWKNSSYSNNDENARRIYTALRIKINKDTALVFSASVNKEKAIAEGSYVFRNINKLKRKQRNAILYKKDIPNKNNRLAYNAALNSINGLMSTINKNLGIVRGFPNCSFYDIRSELVSLKPFGKRKEVYKILNRIKDSITNKGLVPASLPSSIHQSVPAIGWFFKRFNKKEQIDLTIQNLQENYIQEGFLIAGAKQTWMDSIERNGASIELQALLLNMASLQKNKKAEEKLKKSIKEAFWKKNSLLDNLHDKTIRPNFILAHYICPCLLNNKEWKECFNSIIPKLWCNWGGIATLNKRNKLFKSSPNKKHNGNSFYYLNNIAAMQMHELNKKAFKDKIKKILDASVNEILWQGFIGHHAEMSLPKKQQSLGLLCHAPASATFVELIEKIK
ncbi:MAG: amylo-alpha-1,6-glucosidase [Nanoarchaeota archaeon]|nr:amylo-alpha-1,6-glucosidase [Nanoarchaeota archaeon]